MAESKYIAIIKAQLDATDLQAQINRQLSSKPINIKVKTNISDIDSLNIATGKMQNQLDAIKIKNKDAFKTQPVQDMGNHVQSLIDNFDGTKKSMGEFQVATGKLRNEVSKVNEAIRTTTSSADNFATTLVKDIGKMVIWAVAAAAIYGTLRKVGEGVQYVKDLNKEMTNIQIVTGMTGTEVQNLANDYNNLAQEMGATTLEVARGSLEWARQGKTVAETQQLLRATMVMSKLGNMDAAQSTEYLTSMLNGFKMEANSAIGIVDRLISVDNAMATSTTELAAAMQRSSNSAQLAGVSMEQLISYIGTVSSVTRKSAESIGF